MPCSIKLMYNFCGKCEKFNLKHDSNCSIFLIFCVFTFTSKTNRKIYCLLPTVQNGRIRRRGVPVNTHEKVSNDFNLQSPCKTFKIWVTTPFKQMILNNPVLDKVKWLKQTAHQCNSSDYIVANFTAFVLILFKQWWSLSQWSIHCFKWMFQTNRRMFKKAIC